MFWVPIVVWLAALVLAVVVLGFCAYEISWKSHRLRIDLERLQGLDEQLRQLQDEAEAVQDRIVRAGSS